QYTWDEHNVIEAGGIYGWPQAEETGGGDHSEAGDVIDPVHQWSIDVASPSGMAIAGGAIWLAGLGGELFFEIPLDHLGESTRHLVGSAISSSPRWIAVETEEQHGWARRSGR